jgi:hypothetical protein
MKRFQVTIIDRERPDNPITVEYDNAEYEQRRGLTKTRHAGFELPQLSANGTATMNIHLWNGHSKEVINDTAIIL